MYPMKRVVLLALASVILGLPTASAAFTDVSETHLNAQAIQYVQNEGIVAGYADGTFKPDAPINRAEFLKIIAEAFEKESTLKKCTNTGITNFTDVDKKAWYAKYLCAATSHGDFNPVQGYPDGTFLPGRSINFVEAAKIMVEYQQTRFLEDNKEAGVENANNPFSVSVPDRTSWFDRYVIYLEVQKAIPLSITTFDKSITRGEMAEMIYRMHAKLHIYATQTFDGLMTKRTLKQEDMEKIWKYYGGLDGGAEGLDASYAMRAADNVSFKQFKEWYGSVILADVYNVSKNSDGSYTFLVMLSEEKSIRKLYRVTMAVTSSGKLQTINSTELEKVTLFDNEGYVPDQGADVRFEKGDLVLHYTTITGEDVELERIVPGEHSTDAIGTFSHIRFSSTGRYLSYSVLFWEGNRQVVYDTETRKKVWEGEFVDGSGFTKNDEYFYACTNACLSLEIYSLVDLKNIEIKLDGLVFGDLTYDLLSNTVSFIDDLDGKQTSRTFNFDTLILK